MGVHVSTNKETFPESIRNQSMIAQDPLSIKTDPSEILPLDSALVIKAPFTEKEITWEPWITIKHPGIYGEITPNHPQSV